MNPEEQKKQAALKSLEFIDDDCILGVGTGSTVNHLISALPSVKNKIDAVTSILRRAPSCLKRMGSKLMTSPLLAHLISILTEPMRSLSISI